MNLSQEESKSDPNTVQLPWRVALWMFHHRLHGKLIRHGMTPKQANEFLAEHRTAKNQLLDDLIGEIISETSIIMQGAEAVWLPPIPPLKIERSKTNDNATSIDELDLELGGCGHAVEVLKIAGITTIEKLITLSEHDLDKVPGLGQSRRKHVTASMRRWKEKHPLFPGDLLY